MAAETVIGYGLEAIILLAGLAVLWTQAVRPRLRRQPPPQALAPWRGTASDLVLLLVCACAGALVLPSLAAAILARVHGVSDEQRLVLGAASFQLGLLGGVGMWHALRAERLAPFRPLRDLASGGATFLAAMPLVFLVGLVWEALLELCGLPVRKQDVVELFQGIQSTPLRAVFILIAVGIAPMSEELIFRAGLFRFFRGRVPRAVALLLPAVLFGASHLLQSVADGLAVLAPLVTLGVVFSLAYERTGRIGTTMVAHALFNLNTLILVLLGVNS